jgi:non-canonical purine NTP pyrophosphatase (RdgB/HAM1 family)
MEQLTYITSHPAKAEQLSRHLKRPVTHLKLDLEEIQSLDLEQVLQHKAQLAFDIVRKPVMVEDFSLQINALGRLPGPFIKWFWNELGTEGVCKLLDGKSDRSAVARTGAGYCDSNGPRIFIGERTGRIADKPAGQEAFGSDAIFIPDGHNKTWAQMSLEEQMETSARKLAIQQLEQFLRSLE